MTALTKYLDEKLRLCEGATDGPWATKGHSGVIPFLEAPKSEQYVGIGNPSIALTCLVFNESEQSLINAAMICDSRTTMPKLIAVIQRLLAEIERSTDRAFVKHCEDKVSEILGVEE